MLKTIWIKNFKSHKNTVIKFDKGVNIIVGTSDSGKSAILSALRWVCHNRPLGDAYRSHWGGDTEVGIETMEGDLICRIKTNSQNMYLVNDQELKNFGNEPPDIVIEKINLLAESIQTQFASPFLLSDSSGVVSGFFNRMANLELIDQVLSNIQSKVRRFTSTMESESGNIEREKANLVQFDFIDAVDILVTEAEEKQKEIKYSKNSILQISELCLNVSNIHKNISRSINPILYVERFLVLYMTKKNDLVEVTAEKTIIEEICISIQEVEKTIEGIDRIIFLHRYAVKFEDIYKKMDLLCKETDILQDIVELGCKYKEGKTEVSHIIEVESILEEYVKINNTITQRDTDLSNLQLLSDECKSAQKDLSFFIISLKDMETKWKLNTPDNCPLCGKPGFKNIHDAKNKTK